MLAGLVIPSMAIAGAAGPADPIGLSGARYRLEDQTVTVTTVSRRVYALEMKKALDPEKAYRIIFR